MNSMVVLFAMCSVLAVSGSYVPLAQPPHHPAVVLDPHGRPLDTAEVIAARALHLQAKHLEHSPLLAHSAVLAAPAVYAAAPHYAAAPYYAGHSYGFPHYLKKRSLGHVAYAAPALYHAAPVATVYAGGSAVSHQSRVDVHSSPAVVAHAPVLAHHAPVYAHAAPLVAHVAPAAVSHQSRVDVRTSPVLAHAAPLHYAPLAHSVHAPLVHSSPLLQHAW